MAPLYMCWTCLSPADGCGTWCGQSTVATDFRLSTWFYLHLRPAVFVLELLCTVLLLECVCVCVCTCVHLSLPTETIQLQ